MGRGVTSLCRVVVLGALAARFALATRAAQAGRLVLVSRKSRDKGYAGEVEVAHLFEQAGHNVQRLQRNRSDMADLLVDSWLYVESKRQERWKLREWIAQVSDVAPSDTVPAVVFRSNREQWGIWLPALDFAERLP
jgi:hypothetical protein